MADLFLVSFFLLFGSLCLYLGAEWLIKGASNLALSMGLTPLAVGLTVVAFGTSMPELAVSVKAALSGSSDLAIGNVIGSNIANIALILGVCSLICPLVVHVQVVKIDTPLMIVVSFLVGILILIGPIGRITGAILFFGVIVYTLFNYMVARNADTQNPEQINIPEKKIIKNASLIVFGIIILVMGGESFVRGAIQAAKMLQISDTVIGLTLVAVGTSLPELATSLVATWKGESDIVIGNIIGSNVFNLLCILGTVSLVTPIDTGGVHLADVAMMVGTSCALLPILWSGHRIKRGEGLFLLCIYASYVAWLYISR